MNPEEYARMHALETDYWWFAGRRAIIESLLREAMAKPRPPQELRLSSASRLLDIGCGTGANLEMLRRAVGPKGQLAGADFSPLALDFARRHESQNSSRKTSLLRADALRLPFADGTFDVVTMFDVLEHLSDDTCALQEIGRVLRSGGALVLSVPAYQRLWSAHDEALHHFRRYEFQGLKRLLHQNGFDGLRLSFAMSMMPPIAWLWRRYILPFKPRRPREAKRHSEGGAVLPAVPPIFNRALIEYLKMEGRIIPHRPLRFGTSLVCIAFKKAM